MTEKSFEALILPAECYKNIIDLSVRIILISIVAMIVLTIVSHRTKRKFRVPFMWYINIPRILISFIAVFAVFFYDFNTKGLHCPSFDNMLMSTFLVGVLGVIELLSCLATMIKDVCDMLNND